MLRFPRFHGELFILKIKVNSIDDKRRTHNKVSVKERKMSDVNHKGHYLLHESGMFALGMVKLVVLLVFMGLCGYCQHCMVGLHNVAVTRSILTIFCS